MYPAGAIVFATGVVALSLVNLDLGLLTPANSLPNGLTARTLLTDGTVLLTLVAGVLVPWRPTAAAAAAALSIYYLLVVAVLIDGWPLLRDFRTYGAYFGIAESVALGAAALSIFAGQASVAPATAALASRAGRYAFALCVLFFAGAHFVYPGNTIPLVPPWLPPAQAFWAYATGVFQIAAGGALFLNICARPAALLLTVMYAAFTPLVHLPLLVSNPTKHFYWVENATNIALVGCAWVIADALIGPGTRPRRPATTIGVV